MRKRKKINGSLKHRESRDYKTRKEKNVVQEGSFLLLLWSGVKMEWERENSSEEPSGCLVNNPKSIIWYWFDTVHQERKSIITQTNFYLQDHMPYLLNLLTLKRL